MPCINSGNTVKWLKCMEQVALCWYSINWALFLSLLGWRLPSHCSIDLSANLTTQRIVHLKYPSERRLNGRAVGPHHILSLIRPSVRDPVERAEIAVSHARSQ